VHYLGVLIKYIYVKREHLLKKQFYRRLVQGVLCRTQGMVEKKINSSKHVRNFQGAYSRDD
jgi:hypothetical protein